MLLLTLFLLLFFALSSLISVIFMLYLPRLEKFLAKRRKTKRATDKNDRNASTLYTPEIKAAKVITLRSWADSLSSRDQTSPNKTSSFNWANLGAKFPRLSRPAVCFLPFEVAKYNYLTLKQTETWGIVVRKTHRLATNFKTWLKVLPTSTNILGTSNLLGNVTTLARQSDSFA